MELKVTFNFNCIGQENTNTNKFEFLIRNKEFVGFTYLYDQGTWSLKLLIIKLVKPIQC